MVSSINVFPLSDLANLILLCFWRPEQTVEGLWAWIWRQACEQTLEQTQLVLMWFWMFLPLDPDSDQDLCLLSQTTSQFTEWTCRTIHLQDQRPQEKWPGEPETQRGETYRSRAMQNHRHLKPVDLETRISWPGDQVLQRPLTHARPAECDCIFSACLCVSVRVSYQCDGEPLL